jgi:hypothetical protein
MQHFTTVRQMHLIDPAHSKSVQANTILVTGIPARYLSESALGQLYSHLPGGIAKIWLNRYVHLLLVSRFSALWVALAP